MKSKKHQPAALPPAPPGANTSGQSELPRQPAPSGQPDITQLGAANLAAAAFPGGQHQPFRVYFAPGIHARLWQHAAETLAVEICGILVGAWGQDAAGPFVVISEAIRGEAATSKF